MYKSSGDHSRPRVRRSVQRASGGSGSRPRDSQDSSPSQGTYPPSPGYAPDPPVAPGQMTIADLVQQPGREHLLYLTPYPKGRQQTW